MFPHRINEIDSKLFNILAQDNIASFQMFKSTLHGKSADLSSCSLAIQISFCSLINESTFIRHLEYFA